MFLSVVNKNVVKQTYYSRQNFSFITYCTNNSYRGPFAAMLKIQSDRNPASVTGAASKRHCNAIIFGSLTTIMLTAPAGGCATPKNT